MKQRHWRVASASVVGTSHLCSDKVCQDAHLVEVVDAAPGKVLIACVSDGAGSAARSEVGAKVACRAWVDFMRTHASADWGTGSQLTERSLQNVREALVAQCQSDETALVEYACTLLGACVRPNQALFVQVGDGAIVVKSQKDLGEFEVVFWPDQGEYANSTRFLTDSDFGSGMRACSLSEKVDEVALFSDGLQRLALQYESKSAFRPFFESTFAHLRASEASDRELLSEALSEFLDSDSVNERTDDDKSLILATRHTP